MTDGIAVRGARCRTEADREHRGRESIHTDAYVVALGSGSPSVLTPIGVPAPIYPVKGYSATIAVGAHRGAPTVSLTDLDRKLVFSRFGDRLRIAGTAEVSGYGKELDRVRCEALITRTFELFPDAGERESREVLGRPSPRHAVQRSAGRPRRGTAISSSTRATERSAGRWRADRGARSRT